MIRVCMITPFGERLGGSDNVLLTLIRHLDRERIEPLVIFLSEGSFRGEVHNLGVRTVALPGGRLRDPRHLLGTIRRLAALFRAERPDLIVSWLSTAHLYAGPAAQLTGMADRCMWWQRDLHSTRAPERARRRDRLATLRGRILDRIATLLPATAVGCVSEEVGAAQRKLWPHRRTFTVQSAVDPPRPVGQDRLDALRSDLALPDDAIVVGIVGRMFPWKGHHLLLRALGTLHGQHPAIFGLFVGGGGHRGDPGYEAYLRRLVGELGLAQRVAFTGQVDDAAPYMQLMDIAVNASSPEPFGLVVLEAMALGVPVVAVDRAGPAEIIVSGESGVLVASNAPAELASGIGELLRDPARRARLATAGRERYLERFNGERMTRELEARILELAG